MRVYDRAIAEPARINPISSDDEPSEAERLETARRYRELQGRRLREAAADAVEGEVVAAGEFATLAFASYAAIPLVGIFFAVIARWLASARSKLPERILLALDRSNLYAISRPGTDPGSGETAAGKELRRWPRHAVRVSAVADRALSTEVVFELGDGATLKLYAPRLSTNPWSSELVRLLGGDAPEPRDLGDSPASGA